MPVSRKRKKKTKSSGRGRARHDTSQREPGTTAPAPVPRELAQAVHGLAAYRDQIDRKRTSRAAAMATTVVADLARAVAEQPDMVVTDAVCERLGAVLAGDVRSPVEERVGPRHLADALPVAAEAAVTAELTAAAGPADSWRAPWRVLTALTCVLPHPHTDDVGEAIHRLRDMPAGRVLPGAPPEPGVTGPVLCSADRYGSRFAVTAAITTPEEPARWYLWDVDACGHEAFTVHSGFHPSSEAALAAWQAEVGQTASAGTVLAPADPRLLADLLPTEGGFLHPGGENREQYAEYHRSKRLAEAVRQALPRPGSRSEADLTAATAAVEFAGWLRTRVSDEPEPENLDELVGELADSWNGNGIDAVYAACSPHRVALCVLHMRNYYLADFAEDLVALLPDWTRWLTARRGTAPELADRCLHYASGRPHPQLGDDDCEVNYLARVIE